MNKIAVLYDAGQAVLSTFDLDEVLQRILGIARDYFHLRNVAILLLDRQSQRRLEQFIDSFPSLSVHRNSRNLSRGAARPEQYSSPAPP